MQSKGINLYVCIRILLGCIFLISGGEKLLGPYQNFLYIIQSYEVIPGPIDVLVARVFPWIEFLIGLFLILGFWTSTALKGFGICVAGFISIVSQALLRRLPIDDCGCFGELIHFPPQVILMFDVILFVLACMLLRKINETRKCGLDSLFS